MSSKRSWAKRLRLGTVVVVGVSLFLAGNIAHWVVSPSPSIARADDLASAERLESPEQGVDVRQLRPQGDFVAGNAIIEPADREVNVAGFAPGRIATIHVAEGDFVEAGMPLVELTSNLERADLAAAEANVEKARAELTRLRRGSRAEDVAAADAEYARATALAALSSDQLSRAEALSENGAITGQELAESKHRADADRAAADRAEAQRRATKRGFRVELIVAAKASLQAAEARRDGAKAALGFRTVTAPSAGEVLQLKVRPGEYYRPGEGDALVILGDTRKLRARVDIYERDIAKLRLGARTIVRAPAYAGTDFAGEVIEIGRRMGRKNVRTDDPTERNDTKILEVLVELEPTTKLIPGQRVVAYVEEANRQ